MMLITELCKLFTVIVLIFMMLVVLTACGDAPVNSCTPDGCYKNGHLVDINNNYIGD